MIYRTIKIDWFPGSGQQWKTYTAVRLEAGRLWSYLVERHAAARTTGEKWPTKAILQREVKRQFPGLHSQSVQQIVGDFCEAITSAEALRRRDEQFAYPYKKPRYRQVIFTNQAAQVRDGVLRLPCGSSGVLYVRVPRGITLPGRLMEVRLNYGNIEVICSVADAVAPLGPVIGIDLGVNTVIAATDGSTAILVSGRAIKATIQLRNKRLAAIQSQQTRKTKGSRRHKRLQRAKARILTRSKNTVRDLCHKATRKIADAFPAAKAYVGKPFNGAAQKLPRRQAQTVAAACNRKIISLLNYKLSACIEVDEAYTSQTCPVCAVRSRHQRVYRCVCGYRAPRDVVGCTNIRTIGLVGALRPGCCVPNAIQWRLPMKYPGGKPGSVVDTDDLARACARESTLP